MFFTSILSNLFYLLYIIGWLYYILIFVYFIFTWIRPLYDTKIFEIVRKIVSPFTNLVSGRLTAGSFDIGATIGLVVYGYLLRIIYNLHVFFM